ncbi:hypothetical protein OU798_02085 [Prolixibacteraceae bacterium Z1-6]|uniref:Uncharacterized protein n=1 Tax=Draconibacterium aestuarii TaxID=2998507 RepID=A0A9X3J374_9BACT|nr:hypothetical protein [Prolixibacteraceae bacterium Z1-6]
MEIKTPKDALLKNVIKVREITACYGANTVQTWLMAWLVVLANKLDLSITVSQAEETALYLIEELYMLNIAELTLFFTKLVKGDYGSFYNKFNLHTIIQGAKKYRKSRGLILRKLPTEMQRKLIN